MIHNFTIHRDENINKKIDLYIKIIRDNIFKIINKNEIKGIILTGSFGQGEGGVLLSDEKEKLINDIDLIIFPKKNVKHFKKKYSKKINDICLDLLKFIPVKQIDINIGNYFKFYIRLNKIFYTVNTHDTVHGHQVIYGDINIKKFQNKYKSTNIPIHEGLKFLYTRGFGVLISLYDKLNNNRLSDLEIYIELNKLKLSIGDSFLIYNKKYHFSYKERHSIARKISFSKLPNGDILKNNYLSSIDWKLKPVKISSNSVRVSEINNLLTLYFDYLIWFEKNRLHYQFKSLEDYILSYNHINLSLIDKLTRRLYFKNNFMVLLFLLDWIKNNNKNKIIEKNIYNYNNKSSNWNDFSKKYLLDVHPNGIVSKIFQ